MQLGTTLDTIFSITCYLQLHIPMYSYYKWIFLLGQDVNVLNYPINQFDLRRVIPNCKWY